jgi:hypothetical protein
MRRNWLRLGERGLAVEELVNTRGATNLFLGCPLCRSGGGREAGEGIRTPDPLITNQMLYQLSYAGMINASKDL